MDPGLVTLCVGVTTALAGGVVSSVVTYRLNHNKEQTIFMRQKAEALYLAADEFGRTFSAHIVTYLPVARGDLDYNQMLDLHIANPADKRQGGYETMTMLAGVYFPEVDPELQALLSVRHRLGDVRNAHKQAYKAGGGVGPTWVAAFQDVGHEADLAIKALRAAILRSAKAHAGGLGKRRRRLS